jgi:tRNA pseudouridine38-40 synthase
VPTYRLDLEYDGTEFHGWQVQPQQRTVQGVLRAALAPFCGGEPALEGAGRTDAGVHALGQVASFTVAAELEPERLLRALAGRLPPDVRVHRAGRAAADFSARHSALSRAYRYQWLRAPSALLGRHHGVLDTAVDTGAMQDAAARLVGDHDFTAFAAAASGGGRCNVIAARVADEGVRLAFEIEADRFLHNMVRRLAGALVDVGRGRSTPTGFAAALDARAPRGPCLPARGLFLVAVRYPPDAVYAASAASQPPPVPPWEAR